MPVFSRDDQISHSISREQFAQYYQDSSTVSMESIGKYFERTRDLFTNIGKMITSDQDKFVQEVLGSKNEISYLAKKVEYVDFRLDGVSRPEMFSSLYVDFLQELSEMANITHTSVLKSLDNLKLAVASFINEYQENQVDSLYGARYFDQEKKVIDAQRDRNKKHYKLPPNKTKTDVQSVIKSMTDFGKIYPLITTCSTVLNKPNADNMEKSVRDVVDLIDALVEQNLKTGVLVKSEGAKKELVSAIDQTARAVEFYTALYAEFFGACSSFKTLTDALSKRG